MNDVNFLKNNGVNVDQSLELLGDIEMYNETMNDFLGEVEDKLVKLDQYKQTGDMPNYAIEVHSLKSDAKYLGFVTLADLSYQSELKSKANDTVFVNDNHDNVMNEARKMIKLSKMYLGMEPVGPLESAAPAPAPAAPVQPVAPATPVQPVTPAAPVQPVTPAVPVQPVAPAAPVQPVAPAAPVQPVAPAAPVQPVAPAAPVQPVAPAPPVQPGAPATPVQPVAPAAPVQPVTPAAPVQPVAPAAPVQPVTPAAPVQPVTPVTPVQPVTQNITTP